MLKFLTPLAIGLLTVISIAPKSQAFPIDLRSISIGQSYRDAQPRIVVKVGGQPEYSNRWDSTRRGYKTYSQSDRYADDRGEYRRDRRHSDRNGEYHRDR